MPTILDRLSEFRSLGTLLLPEGSGIIITDGVTDLIVVNDWGTLVAERRDHALQQEQRASERGEEAPELQTARLSFDVQ